MLREHAQKLLLEIDEIEADMRRMEHRLYRIRERLAQHFGLRKGEYGFVEGVRDKT